MMMVMYSFLKCGDASSTARSRAASAALSTAPRRLVEMGADRTEHNRDRSRGDVPTAPVRATAGGRPRPLHRCGSGCPGRRASVERERERSCWPSLSREVAAAAAAASRGAGGAGGAGGGAGAAGNGARSDAGGVGSARVSLEAKPALSTRTRAMGWAALAIPPRPRLVRRRPPRAMRAETRRSAARCSRRGTASRRRQRRRRTRAH